MTAAVKVVKKVVKKAGKVIEKAAKNVVNTVKAVIKDPLPTLLAIGGQAIGIPAPVTMALITGARGGDLEDMAKAAAITYVGGKVAPVIAPTISNAVSGQIANQAIAKAVTNSITSGLVAGTSAAIQGKDFGEAFAGAATGSAIASGVSNIISEPVLAKAKELGFSDSTGKLISSTLTGATTSGTMAAIQGGDFGDAFTEGVVNSGVDYAAMTATDALKTAYNEFTADKPKVANVNDDAYDQILAAFEAPKSPGVGTQIGLPLAANTLAETSGYVTERFPEGSTEAGIFNPIEVSEKANLSTADQSKFLDEMKKSALTGDTSALSEGTEFGELPPSKSTTVSSDIESAPLYPSIDFSNIPDLKNIADATNKKASEINQQHDALVDEIKAYESSSNKTPEKAAEIEQKVNDYNTDYAIKSAEIADLKKTYDDVKNTLIASQPSTEFGDIPTTPSAPSSSDAQVIADAQAASIAATKAAKAVADAQATEEAARQAANVKAAEDARVVAEVKAIADAKAAKDAENTAREAETARVAEESRIAALKAEAEVKAAEDARNIAAAKAVQDAADAQAASDAQAVANAVAAKEAADIKAEEDARVAAEAQRIAAARAEAEAIANAKAVEDAKLAAAITSGGLPTTGGAGSIGGLPTGGAGLVDDPYLPLINVPYSPEEETGSPFPGVDFNNYPLPGVTTGGTGSALDGSSLSKEDGFLPPVEVIGDVVFPGVDFTNYPPPAEVGPDVETQPPFPGVDFTNFPPPEPIGPDVEQEPTAPVITTPPSGGLPTTGGGTATPNLNYGLTTQTSTYKPSTYVENPSFTLFPVPQRKQQFDPFSQYFRIGGLAAIKRK